MIRRPFAPLLLAAMWAFAGVVFRRLPPEIPTHWNLAGEGDGGGPRFPAASRAPAVATGVWLLMRFQASIDPRRADVERSTPTRRLLAEILVGFMAVLEVLTLGIALGWPLDMGEAMWPLLGLLFVALGNYLPRVRPNWFLGVRTPWTLASDAVWRDTHRLAGWAFVAAGVLTAGAMFLPVRARPLVGMAALLLAAGVPLVYSFVRWRREERR
ncbi:MAG TPA: SdpI family protein [Longimicrobiaceae bacterium]|nr:SdpI family protein [Longimicrobiaceae bacterium]